jgi:two-component system, NtrC family, sensor kinase
MAAPKNASVVARRRTVAELEAELEQRTAERDEALAREAVVASERDESEAQKAAIAEVLGVINASPGDLAPVFDAMLDKALELCGANFGQMITFDGSVFHADAWRGYEPLTGGGTIPKPGMALYELVRGKSVIHVPDITDDDVYRSGDATRRRLADEYGARTAIWIALRKETELLGAFVIYRTEICPFTEKQVALLQNFAAQAVIAMENARLVTETREALEQQTATAEVLGVINSSPGDLAPVFDAMLEKAMRLCGASLGVLGTYDGTRFTSAAERGVTPAYAEFRKNDTGIYGPGTGPARLLDGEPLVHIPDLKASEPYLRGDANRRALVDLGDARASLMVPLLKDRAVRGYIMIYRKEAGPFSDKQIALLQNFAAQAVIAMENARLLGELRERTSDLEESLEYQTATSDVLKVISGSVFELQPVLDIVVATAVRLCRADQATLYRLEDGEYRWAASHAFTSSEYDRIEREVRIRPGTGSLIGRVALSRDTVQIADAWSDPLYEVKEDARVGGVRTLLGVPLLREGVPVGAIGLARRRVEPYLDKEIALVRTFADQAVIAMENARLLGELRERTTDLEESLEYQTATSDVLQVISRSTFDLDAVLRTVVSSAVRLCRGHYGVIFRNHGGEYRYAAGFGSSPEYEEHERQAVIRPGRGTIVGRAALEGRAVQIADALNDPDYEDKDAAATDNARTMLGVPLLREGQVIGAFGLARNRIEPFSDREVELVTTFADQAALAIENARLLGELRERTSDLEESLEYQTATSDVLKVIGRSTFDLQPVLATVTETAARLCEAEMGFISRRDGDVFRFVTVVGSTPEAIADAMRLKETFLDHNPFRLGRETITGRIVSDSRALQIADITADPDYKFPEAIEVAKIRTLLGVPMFRQGVVVGTLSLARQRVEPFTERQIELVRTFADQAVIAIENTRLLTETREALEQQQAMAEVLGVINASPGDLTPVFAAMLERATRLCEAETAHLLRYENGVYSRAGSHGVPEDFDKIMPLGQSINQVMNEFSGPMRVLVGRAVYQMDDVREDESYRTGAPAEVAGAEAGIRTALFVPLLREGEIAGCFVMHRMEVRPFSDKQIALMASFAAQAVIAIDNARLLDEIRQRQAELRVTFDNMGDGVAMFDAEMKLAAWNLNFQKILDLPDEFVAERPSLQQYFEYMKARGEYGSAPPELESEIRRGVESAGHESRFERTRPDGRVIEVRRNAVPGGGSVLIFSDVTERKRAEEEIRTARDAAEKALGELKLAQANLIQSEKMASLGQLTAGIAHEIKNPLNFVNNFAGLSVELLDELKEAAGPAIESLDADTRAEIDETVEMLTGNLEKIAEHGRRADGIVRSMLEHSRGASGERRPVDLNALIEEALNLAYHGARAQDQSFNITLERDFASAIAPIELVPQDVTRVFLNLFGNGFYAATKRAREGGNGAFKPALRVTTRELGDAVEVLVRDNGTGIPAEIKDKLFQPFFTTKPTGEGTGLGLSISYDIVTQQHGGTIAVDSEPGEFTQFTVRLPRTATGAATGGATTSRLAASRGS